MNLLPILLRPFARAAGVVSLALSTFTVSAGASEREATLEAIRQIENPRNLTRPGPCGELGPYQFRADTWRMHTTEPFAQALDRPTAERVAVQHYEWIRRGLEKARLPATTYHIALAWNGGLQSVVSGKSPRAAHRYAERAANLAAVLRREQGVGVLAANGALPVAR